MRNGFLLIPILSPVYALASENMSMGDVDSKFPGQRSNGLPPSPSRENPGQVFPQSDPKESVPGTGGEREPRGDELLGNPYVLEDAFAKLDGALSEIISKIQSESRSVGAAAGEDALLEKFEGWRSELAQLRSGRRAHASGSAESSVVNQQEGGLFTD
ncbi:hypothetical protein C8Q77DRAFT_1073890 [Trametes polyzona]|nr:hypothetical protein C8Q77DRAFT_1073890 [Trametes polyzona]